MANTQSINERLLKVLNSDKNQGYVIGLTGEWGIGKTHFWKNFYKEKRSELGCQKYAYISLFGIDSLDGLKYEIAIQTQATSTDKKDSILTKPQNNTSNLLRLYQTLTNDF